MANRAFVQPKGYMEKGVCTLYCNITTGTAGAVVAGSGGKGIASVSRTSAGLYLITLQDTYSSLLKCVASVRGPAGTGVPTAAKAAVAVAYNSTVSTTTKTINVQCLRSDTMAAADVTDTWSIDVEIVLKDSLV